ncbi:MAG: dUTP diphosphatase [Candidatus Woesearchaeota archaeon]|jgi:dUTP pyrophosphatase|nr:dUTP diphosphatase [Candidatus Woesearchaeota archaeon]
MKIEIVNNSNNTLPEYSTSGAASMDVQADFSKEIKSKFLYFSEMDEERNTLLIFSGGRALVPTNLHVAIPKGYEFKVRPRSGLALKEGVTVLNTPGCIDSDYRGSVGVILQNFSDDVFEVQQGDRIAQISLERVDSIEWKEVEELDKTSRNEGGFGSTGKK